MNKRIKKVLLFLCLILVAGVCYGDEPQDVNSAANKEPAAVSRGDGQQDANTTTKDVNSAANDEPASANKDDPFAGIFGRISSSQGGLSAPQSSGTPVETKPNLFAKTVTLKFLTARNLKAALDKMSSTYGSIAIDETTNSLIVCDTNDNLGKILEEIKSADQTPKQIIIEVVIIDVQLENDTEIGVDWDLLSTDIGGFAYRQSMINPNRLTYILPTTDTSGNLTNSNAAYRTDPLGTKIGGEVSLTSGTVRNVVHLLQEKRTANILASPRIMVVSGQKAQIKTVEEIPYQEITQSTAGGGATNAITSTQFKEVGVTLDVKATLADDGKIVLEAHPTQSVSVSLNALTGVPTIDQREASTTLLMDDGQVAVIGGLRRQETTMVKMRIPLLGDLPVIGALFSDNHKVVDNSELLVLLSPHVYKDEPVPADAMARYNSVRNKPLLSVPAESKDQLFEQIAGK